MPTRSFGDMRLKHKDFNFHTMPPDLGYRKVIPQFTGPYVSHAPDIMIHELNPQDEWLVIGSDGLWDEVKRPKVAEVAKE